MKNKVIGQLQKTMVKLGSMPFLSAIVATAIFLGLGVVVILCLERGMISLYTYRHRTVQVMRDENDSSYMAVYNNLYAQEHGFSKEGNYLMSYKEDFSNDFISLFAKHGLPSNKNVDLKLYGRLHSTARENVSYVGRDIGVRVVNGNNSAVIGDMDVECSTGIIEHCRLDFKWDIDDDYSVLVDDIVSLYETYLNTKLLRMYNSDYEYKTMSDQTMYLAISIFTNLELETTTVDVYLYIPNLNFSETEKG